MFQFGGLGTLFGGTKPTKAPPVETELSRLWTNFEETADHTIFSYKLLRMSAASEGIKITLKRTYNVVNYRLG